MLLLLRLLAPYVVWLYLVGVFVLVIYLRNWLVASRDLRASLFRLEREMAVARMRRAAAGAFAVFGMLIVLFFAQFYLGRNLGDIIKPTPTPDFGVDSAYEPTPDSTLAPGETPAATPTHRPTRRPVTLVPSPTVTLEFAPTDTPPPQACPHPGAVILQPGAGARIKGRIDIRGTADIPNFQFYKIEVGLGENPSYWTSISDVHRSPVNDGLLEVWDTTDLPAGSYTVRLVVVDITGNYVPPCEARVYVAH